MTDAAPAKEKPNVPPKRLHLRPDEAQRLIVAAGRRGRCRDRDRVLVRLIYRHGLRASEACDLRWDAIDLDAGSMLIRRKKMGKDSTHTCDRDELGDLRRMHKASTSSYVFVTERGGPLSVDTVQVIVAKAGVLCGLPDAHPHMLRHAAGYCLTNEGIDSRLVQEFLGHKTPAMTMHYSAISPRRLAAVRVR